MCVCVSVEMADMVSERRSVHRWLGVRMGGLIREGGGEEEFEVEVFSIPD